MGAEERAGKTETKFLKVMRMTQRIATIAQQSCSHGSVQHAVLAAFAVANAVELCLEPEAVAALRVGAAVLEPAPVVAPASV